MEENAKEQQSEVWTVQTASFAESAMGAHLILSSAHRLSEQMHDAVERLHHMHLGHIFVYKLSNLQTYKLTNLQTLQTYKLTNFQTYKLSNLQSL